MKTWINADIIELNIEETAYGKNEHAKEANANKHPNNGAGGSLNSTPDLPGNGETTVPSDEIEMLS